MFFPFSFLFRPYMAVFLTFSLILLLFPFPQTVALHPTMIQFTRVENFYCQLNKNNNIHHKWNQTMRNHSHRQEQKHRNIRWKHGYTNVDTTFSWYSLPSALCSIAVGTRSVPSHPPVKWSLAGVSKKLHSWLASILSPTSSLYISSPGWWTSKVFHVLPSFY